MSRPFAIGARTAARRKESCLLVGLSLLLPLVGPAQSVSSIPTFAHSFQNAAKEYVDIVAGGKPELGGTTTIQTVLVLLSLSFDAGGRIAGPTQEDLQRVLSSPIFEDYPFATGNTQYADAVQRAAFFETAKHDWHTLLQAPYAAASISIHVPAEHGYALHSKKSGKILAIADMDFVRRQLFTYLKNIGASPDKLLIALTKDTAFYSLGDATVCCSVGSHNALPGGPGKAAQPLVIASYFDGGSIRRYSDIQGVTQQIAEWMNDPLQGVGANHVPRWLQPPLNVKCQGPETSSAYLVEQPTDTSPLSNAFAVHVKGTVYHLENVALLPWYEQAAQPRTFQSAYSFPDTHALAAPAKPCSSATRGQPGRPEARTNASSNGHKLIGYWEGVPSSERPPSLREVAPQWDIIIAIFASPVKGSTSQLHFEPPNTASAASFKADVQDLQRTGKKVLISIGGGGAVVTLLTTSDVQKFVSSIIAIVEKYGFDGIDLDIETPSLLIDQGDTDFRRPTTRSIVNLIDAVHQIYRHFGPKFMLAEVPEAAQAQAGMVSYAGQFGSFLPVIYGTRDILSFVDAQDYNTPPLEGLDENYYFPGTADYHVALAEMLVRGFPVAGNSDMFFPALPPSKVAIGLPATPWSARNYTAMPAVADAMKYLVRGEPYAGAGYTLRAPSGYPAFLGAMFWAINEDARNGYQASNATGRLLHSFPKLK